MIVLTSSFPSVGLTNDQGRRRCICASVSGRKQATAQHVSRLKCSTSPKIKLRHPKRSNHRHVAQAVPPLHDIGSRKFGLKQPDTDRQPSSTPEAKKGISEILWKLPWRQHARSVKELASQGEPAAKELEKLGNNKVFTDSIGLVVLPAYLLGALSAVIGLPTPIWAPTLAGAALGGLFACVSRHLSVRVWLSPERPLSVIVTGGSKGLGKALARDFLHYGDKVLITSRTQAGLSDALAELRKELRNGAQVYGVVCDVSDPDSVLGVDSAARRLLGGRVDAWVNNAGYSGSFQSFLEASDDQLTTVVRTNLLGTILCSRQAFRLFKRQRNGGHIFNMDGAGADGLPTPQYAAYGATKAGIAHLSASLSEEAEGTGSKIHTVSPGMILTDLLLEGATVANKQAFNILCEQPETVAAFLVPRLRSIVALGEADQYVRYLTAASAVYRLMTAPGRIGRFFDSEGNAVYPSEQERLEGKRYAKSTARSVAAARKRNQPFKVAYSFSLLIALALVVQAAQAAHGPL